MSALARRLKRRVYEPQNTAKRIRWYAQALRQDRRRLFWFSALLLTLLFYAVSFSFVHLITGDDLLYRQTAHGGLLPYLAGRFATWSGRLSADGLIYVFLHLGGLWAYRLAMPLTALLLGWTFMRALTPKPQESLLLFALLLPLLFNPFILIWSVYWFSGSFNYFVPAALAFASLIPAADGFFRNRRTIGNVRFAFCLVAGAVGALGNEQAGAAASALGLLFILSRLCRKKRVCVRYYALTGVTAACTAINVLAPGSRRRWVYELRWFPDFTQLTFLQHLKYDAAWFFSSVVTVQQVLLLALSLLPLLFYRRYTGFSRWACRIFAGLFLLFAATLPNVSSFGQTLAKAKVLLDFGFLQQNYKTPLLAHGTAAAAAGLVPVVFWTVYLALLVYLVCRAGKHPLLILFLFLTAFGTLAMLFFSPTIAASGQRTQFVCSLLLGFILYERLWEEDLLRRPTAAFCMACAGLASAVPAVLQTIQSH